MKNQTTKSSLDDSACSRRWQIRMLRYEANHGAPAKIVIVRKGQTLADIRQFIYLDGYELVERLPDKLEKEACNFIRGEINWLECFDLVPEDGGASLSAEDFDWLCRGGVSPDVEFGRKLNSTARRGDLDRFQPLVSDNDQTEGPAESQPSKVE